VKERGKEKRGGEVGKKREAAGEASLGAICGYFPYLLPGLYGRASHPSPFPRIRGFLPQHWSRRAGVYDPVRSRDAVLRSALGPPWSATHHVRFPSSLLSHK